MIANTDTKHYLDLTDSVYRFMPSVLTPEDTKRIHGFNERLGVKNYEKTINYFYHLMRNADAASIETEEPHSELWGEESCTMFAEDFEIFGWHKSSVVTFSSPEATLFFVSTKNLVQHEVRDKVTSFNFAHVQSQAWQSDWLRVRNKFSAHALKIVHGQKSRFLVLTKRCAASGNKDALDIPRFELWKLKITQDCS